MIPEKGKSYQMYKSIGLSTLLAAFSTFPHLHFFYFFFQDVFILSTFSEIYVLDKNVQKHKILFSTKNIRKS